MKDAQVLISVQRLDSNNGVVTTKDSRLIMPYHLKPNDRNRIISFAFSSSALASLVGSITPVVQRLFLT